MNERILAHFTEQAAFSTLFGSPFTGQLIERMGRDLEADGPVAALIGDWPTNPRADALSLRLAGALHFAALTGRDAHLAALYPPSNAAWTMGAVWPVARAFLQRERAWVADFIKSAPQTNETRRSIAIFTAFQAFAQTYDGPIDMLELGASAGLNTNWNRFHYKTASWSWGDRSSAVQIDTDWNGPTPPVGPLNIRSAAACDLNPLDITDPAQRLQLRSYVWPDQPERLARFDGAVALALQAGRTVERADAAQWVQRKLAARARDAATVIYHSIFLQYPPRETRTAIADAIRAAGECATDDAPVAWIRVEPEALTDGGSNSIRVVIDLTTWPGGERRIIGYTDGHVRGVYVAD
jgi:hypothetical protein